MYGTLTSVGAACRAPIGRLDWAGSASDIWYGYIEGGVRAGQRAATRIFGDLEPA